VAVEAVTNSVAWRNKTHGYGSARILEAVGMARYCAVLYNKQLIEIAPSTWRKCVTGSGKKAPDKQYQLALERMVLGWPKGASSHRCAAACVAIAGAMMARRSSR
jgi:Holliday junction resolvasome RuvABC endonuclease subunit